MFCKNCGKELKDEARFCNRCGTCLISEGNNQEKNKIKQEYNSMDTTGILIILAILTSFILTFIIIQIQEF